MTTAGPWSVKGIDPKARELAKDLARRSGMTLGEWLNHMITEGEAEEDYDPPPRQPPPQLQRPSPAREIRLSSDAEMKRVTRALDVLTQRVEAAEHRSTLAISGIDQQVMGVLSRMEGLERDRAAVAARFDDDLQDVKEAQVKVSDRLRRMADEEAPRLEAMQALEGALSKIAEKLYDTESKTRSVLNEVREDMSNASRRIDRVESRVESKGEPEPVEAIVEAVAAKLGARMIEAESRTAQAIKAMEVSFVGLDKRLRSTEAPSDDSSPERRFERLAAELSEKIETNRQDLTQRLSAAADGKLDRMEAALRELSGHVEQGERRSAQAIDRMGREVMRIAHTLGDRVASVEARTAEAAQQMGGEMARIAEAMEQRMGRADQVQAEALERLGGEIAKIAERLADRIANAERRSAAAIDDVGEQVGRVTERLNERYESNQGALAERIRASEERTAKLLEDARESIDRRLLENQRRASLEAALAEARRNAAEQEAQRAASAHAFPDDPFGPEPAAVPPALQAHEPDYAAPDYAPPAADPFDDPFEPHAAPVFAEPHAAAAPAAERLDDAFDDFDAATEADVFAPPPPAEAAAPEPLSTRDVVAAARLAARQSSERVDQGRGKRDGRKGGIDLSGSIAAPALETGMGKGGFSFGMPGRKKKDASVNLRTLVVASGTAAALAVTAVGATLYLAAESGPAGERVDRTGPAPTAVRPDDHRVLEASASPPAGPAVAPAPAPAATPPADTLAVALAPSGDGKLSLPSAKAKPASAPASKPAPVAATPGLAAPAGGMDAHAYYNTAVQRLQTGDVSGADDLQKAANLGFAPAQFYLAKLYETGGSGIKKDLSEARRWTQRAAEAGDARAMHNLALYEFNGEGGPKDQPDAAHWFTRAAAQGVVDSQYNLGRLYENGGYGVPQNKTEAYKWYLIAAGKGDHDARASADALKAQLPADQATAAERAALGFVAQKPSAVETARVP